MERWYPKASATYLKSPCRFGYCLPPGVRLLKTPKACDSRIPLSGLYWNRSNEPRGLEETWTLKPSENSRWQQAVVCSALETPGSQSLSPMRLSTIPGDKATELA